MRSGASRTTSMGNKAKQFYCTVFGQMDKSQTNLAVVLRTYFYPKEELTGALVSLVLTASPPHHLTDLAWKLYFILTPQPHPTTSPHNLTPQPLPQKNVEERWDDNASFKIICNHEVNSDPPSVMLCNPVSVKAKPGAQFRIDLLNQEAVSWVKCGFCFSKVFRMFKILNFSELRIH